MTRTSASSNLSSYFQAYLSKQLVDRIKETLKLNDYAQQVDLPKNIGSSSVKFFQYDTAPASSNVQTLTEGTPISTFREVGLNSVSVSLTQYGEAVKISDVLSMTSLFDVLKEAVGAMGEEAALKADDLSRDQLVTGTDVGGNGTTKRYGQGIADFTTLNSTAAASAFLDAEDLMDAVTALKANKANPLNGQFVALVPPQISRDLFRDTDFLNTVYRNPETKVGSFPAGTLGSFYGVRIAEHTNPFIEGSTAGTYSASGSIYSTVVLGANAFGVVKIAGDSPFSPRIILNNAADKADPLNQTTVAGWKSFFAAKLLNAKRAVVIKSKSRFA
jgi:N4-gp56 family major capsid protein